MKFLSSFVAAIACTGAGVAAQTTERVSVSTSDVQANGFCVNPSISADGRYVSFMSSATNLVLGDTNASKDIFLRDLLNHTTERIDLADGTNAQVIGNCSVSSVDSEGHYVAFDSDAPDLVAGDNNLMADAFVRDRLTGRTELVSVATNSVQGNAGSGAPVISADGRFVAFISYATNLAVFLNDLNGCLDVFVRDRLNHATERISISSNGVEGNQQSFQPSISADGRYVAFTSYSDNLIQGDTNYASDVFLRDRVLHKTELVSAAIGGGVANQSSISPSLSADGRYVAFASLATNLTSDASGWWNHIYVRDRVAGTTTRVSVAFDGSQADFHSVAPSISADGRYVAFDSYATNLVPLDANGHIDLFVRDRLHASTELASVSTLGAQGNKDIGPLVISADGRRVVFSTSASNLVAGDSNAASDVFVRDRGLLYPGTFCTAGTSTNSCVASIAGAGVPSASSSSGFTISVSDIEGQKHCLLFYGVHNAGFTPTQWGGGASLLCVKSPLQRMGVQGSGGTNNACDGVLALDWNAFIAGHPSALGQPFFAGRHVFAQAWYRDPPSPKTTNLSNGLEFVVGP